jgi:pimeloyl-ACP methyl ester carboxylesterase
MSAQRTSGQVVSKDGTHIAYDRQGSGPPLILVVGALCSRALGPSVKLSPLLATQFTVFSYDRRGRGQSADNPPYRVEREIEDLEALIAEAGGSAFVFGHSSGALLGLRASEQGLAIHKLALYEAPLIVDRSRPSMQGDWAQIREHIAEGRRSQALTVFLKSVGLPAFVLAIMRFFPVWSKIEAVAHTLPYDGAISEEFQRGEPLSANAWSHVTVPVLAIAGGKSPAWMQRGMRTLAAALSNAQHHTLEGQSHDASARALEPLLRQFFLRA